MESELVSGFMTEHAAVVFVFFFLAEYGSIVLMCILTSLLFLGGYLPISFIYNLVCFITFPLYFGVDTFNYDFITGGSELYLWLDPIFREYSISNYSNLEGLLYGLNIGLKSSIMIFIFI